ncbi:DUF2092 domain-containing protein [Megalodesulfovibrio paquesii]
MQAVTRVAIGGLICLMCVLAGSALAQEAPSQKKADGLEPKAAAVYRNLCSEMKSLRNFSVQADITTDTVFEDGTKIQYHRETMLDVRRPANFRAVTRGDDYTFSTFFNGKTFTLVLPKKQRYGQLQADMDTNALLDKLSVEYGMDSPLGDVLMNDPCASVQPEAGFYVGRSMIDGVACHHLLLQGEEVDWQLWVEDSGRALPRKMVITEKLLPQAPQFVAVFKNWKQHREGDAAFVYKPSPECLLDADMFAKPAAQAQQATP